MTTKEKIKTIYKTLKSKLGRKPRPIEVSKKGRTNYGYTCEVLRGIKR